MIDIMEGTLEIVEACNGFYLYGYSPDTGTTFLGMLGDGVDSLFSDPDYDPNEDYDLPEAYGFNII